MHVTSGDNVQSQFKKVWNSGIESESKSTGSSVLDLMNCALTVTNFGKLVRGLMVLA